MNVYYTCQCDGLSDCPLLGEFRVLCGRCAFSSRAFRCCESCDRTVPLEEAEGRLMLVVFKEELEGKHNMELEDKENRTERSDGEKTR